MKQDTHLPGYFSHAACAAVEGRTTGAIENVSCPLCRYIYFQRQYCRQMDELHANRRESEKEKA
jgi:hypothetical protein